jgi:anaerobic ribonucleoside-triphosphate reductase
MKQKIVCHDCGKTLKNNEEFMSYVISGAEYFKCKECHQKDSVLRNFQKAEVYSRVVGYIRPVEQWNKGKKTEFTDRVTFAVEGPACC